MTTCSRAGGCAWFNYPFLTAYERDNETGLDYAQARYYGSTAGRFMSVDPLAGNTEDPQTLNRYVYTRNNPLKYIDPDGLDFWIMGQGDYCNGKGKCDKDGYVIDGKGNRVTVTNGQIRNRADSLCFTCEGGEYTANVNEAGVQITNGQGQTFTGTFTENAVKLLGDDKLKDFTFNITSSSLKDGVLAKGTFAYYGTNEETKQVLSQRGAFSYLLDIVNPFHPGTTQYRFANLPPLRLTMPGNIDAIRLQAENFGASSHLSIANRPKSNVPKTTGEWHVDNMTGVKHLSCATLGRPC